MIARRTGAASLLRILGNWLAQGSREPAYRQLAAALRLLILDGRLGLETRLPGERELAAALGLSRGTIATAFAELRADGYLASRRGSGSLVTLPAGLSANRRSATQKDFSIAASPAGPAIHQAYVEALAALPAYLSSTGYSPSGLLELRTEIAARYAARGLPTGADEIMVVNGALSGFGLLLRHLTGAGDRVVIDHPTYPLAIAAIRGAACRPVPIPLPDIGWDVEGLAAAIGQTTPRLAYLLPDHHNPTGRCMDAETRAAVAAIAERTRTTIVADETMVDLWYENEPPPPLAAYDRGGHVITLGSTGKSFWGGLRIGWIRAPVRMIAALAGTRDAVDLGTPVLEQLAVARLLVSAETHLPARRQELRRRRDALISAGEAILPDWRFPSPAGGLACWIELPQPLATRLAATAETIGIRIAAGPSFGIDGAFERNIRMPFTPDVADLRAALERIAPLWRRLADEGMPQSRTAMV
ncbi:MAG: PLP-dependent aminotransferase family protein [Pseudomonadota bacterium]